MDSIQRRFLIALAATATLAGACALIAGERKPMPLSRPNLPRPAWPSPIKFYPDDPLRNSPRGMPVKDPAPHFIGAIYDIVYHSFKRHEMSDWPYTEKLNYGIVNTLDEALNSSAFINRRLTRERMVAGPLELGPPSETGKLTVIDVKTSGVTPGFRVRDDKGAVFFLKLDPVDHPEMASAADVIGSRIFHAIGYNVPENYIAYFPIERLTVGDEKIFLSKGDKRLLNDGDVRTLFFPQKKNAQGMYRGLFSRLIPGKAIGGVRFYEFRTDDPNDIAPHEQRREVRGYFTFCAWLNHDDSRDINTMDFVQKDSNGQPFIKHYLIDFGSILGSASTKINDAGAGFNYFIEPDLFWKRLVSLGLYAPEHYRKASYPDLPSIGRFEAELFEPDLWKPEYPNIAFNHRTPADDFWGAKKVMQFSDDDIRALVDTGRYTDPKASEYVTRTLIKRRDKIGGAFFAKVLPLDEFRVASGELQYTDLAEHHKFRPQPPYEIEWFAYDNDKQTRRTLNAKGFRIPPWDGPYLTGTISTPGDEKRVYVYLRRKAGAFEVVGLERTW